MITNEKQKIPTYCQVNALWDIIGHTNNRHNSYVYKNTCVFIHINHVGKHTHMHRTEWSEIKWEQFQIRHDHFPLLSQVSQEDGFLQETAGILTPAWKPIGGNY